MRPGINKFTAGLLLAGLTPLLSATGAAQDRLDPQGPERGRAVYEYWCTPCHADGREYPGTQSLAIKYDGELPAVLLERSDLSAEAIKRFVRQGVLSMAPFRKTEITDAELEDLTAYMTQ